MLIARRDMDREMAEDDRRQVRPRAQKAHVQVAGPIAPGAVAPRRQAERVVGTRGAPWLDAGRLIPSMGVTMDDTRPLDTSSSARASFYRGDSTPGF